MQGSSFEEVLKAMKDWSFSIIFTDKQQIIAKTGIHSYNLSPQQMKFYSEAYNSREKTVGWGFEVDQFHFEVHRFHPPLIYGRRGGPDDGQGVALARIKPNQPKGDESEWFLLITYDLPVLSAKAVPQMVKFSEKYCKTQLRQWAH